MPGDPHSRAHGSRRCQTFEHMCRPRAFRELRKHHHVPMRADVDSGLDADAELIERLALAAARGDLADVDFGLDADAELIERLARALCWRHSSRPMPRFAPVTRTVLEVIAALWVRDAAAASHVPPQYVTKPHRAMVHGNSLVVWPLPKHACPNLCWPMKSRCALWRRSCAT